MTISEMANFLRKKGNLSEESPQNAFALLTHFGIIKAAQAPYQARLLMELEENSNPKLSLREQVLAVVAQENKDNESLEESLKALDDPNITKEFSL
jgi:arginine/lysine/ornithine decarboxylase